MMLRRRLSSLAMLTALAQCGCAAPASPAPDEAHRGQAVGASACAFGAFVQEEDPAGLNVRNAPGTHGAVLGRLPPTLHGVGEFGLDIRIEVDVLGASDSGRKLTVKSQASAGYAAPDATGEPIGRFVDGGSFDGDDLVAAGHLVSCKGPWAQVEFADRALTAESRRRLLLKPAARTGLPTGVFRLWLDQICGVQETTCDGLAGAEAESDSQAH